MRQWRAIDRDQWICRSQDATVGSCDGLNINDSDTAKPRIHSNHFITIVGLLPHIWRVWWVYSRDAYLWGGGRVRTRGFTGSNFTLTAKPLNGVVFEMLELSSGRRRLLVFCVRLECVRFVWVCRWPDCWAGTNRFSAVLSESPRAVMVPFTARRFLKGKSFIIQNVRVVLTNIII